MHPEPQGASKMKKVHAGVPALWTLFAVAAMATFFGCSDKDGTITEEDGTTDGIYIGDTRYDSLLSALQAAEGTTATIAIHDKSVVYSNLVYDNPSTTFYLFPEGTHITLEGKGSGERKVFCSAFVSPFFRLTKDTSLTLKNITLDGAYSTTTRRSASIIEVSGGTFTMLEGSKIVGNNHEGSGGGVYISEASGGDFIMKGGFISGNTVTAQAGVLRTGQGGGVVMAGGTFTMEGGEISGNTATHVGGLYLRGGHFTMKGGTLRANSATGSANRDNLGLYFYNNVPQGTATYGDGTPILEPGSDGTSEDVVGRN
jgi:hypothetical protein